MLISTICKIHPYVNVAIVLKNPTNFKWFRIYNYLTEWTSWQSLIFLALTIKAWERQRLNEWRSDKSVCRKALATPGLSDRLCLAWANFVTLNSYVVQKQTVRWKDRKSRAWTSLALNDTGAELSNNATVKQLSSQTGRIVGFKYPAAGQLLCSALHFSALLCTGLHWYTRICTDLHCSALHCTALYWSALLCYALLCNTLVCNALQSVLACIAV